jgi:hypothetical protein
MFRCPITKRVTRAGDKMIRVVIEKRPKTYYSLRLNEETGKLDTIEAGKGWEIVKELGCSEEGARTLMEQMAAKELKNASQSI